MRVMRDKRRFIGLLSEIAINLRLFWIVSIAHSRCTLDFAANGTQARPVRQDRVGPVVHT